MGTLEGTAEPQKGAFSEIQHAAYNVQHTSKQRTDLEHSNDHAHDLSMEVRYQGCHPLNFPTNAAEPPEAGI